MNKPHMHFALGNILNGAVLATLFFPLARSIGILQNIFIAKCMPISEVGIYVLAFSIFSLFANLSGLGLSQAVKYYIPVIKASNALAKERHLLIIAGLIVITTGTLFVCTGYLVAPKLSHFFRSDVMPTLLILFLSIPFYALLNLQMGGFQAYNHPLLSELVSVSMRAGVLLCAFILSFGLEINSKIFASCNLFFYGVCSIFFIYVFQKYCISLVGKIEEGVNIKKLLSYSIPLSFSGVLSLMFLSADTIILGYYVNSAELAIYNMGFLLAYTTKFLVFDTFSSLFVPSTVTYLNSNNKAAVGDIFSALRQTSLVLIIPIASFLLLNGEAVLVSLFGLEYANGASTINILIFFLVLSVSFGHATSILSVERKTKVILKITLICTVMNILLNILLIPMYGVLGAAISTACAELGLAILPYLSLNKAYRVQNSVSKNIIYFIFCLIIAYGYRNLFGVQTIYALIALSLLYCILMLLLAVMGKLFPSSIVEIATGYLSDRLKPFRLIFQNIHCIKSRS